MDNTRFLEIRDELNEVCEGILGIKGKDYTIGNQDTDKLFNFREVAKMTGGAPLEVLAVYWLKHVYAIMAYVKSGKPGSEPIRFRIADARNYLDLMDAMIIEGECLAAD